MVTLNPKYKRIGSDAKYSIVTGGRGSGKSFALTYLISLLSYEQGHVILYTRYTLRAAYISIIPEFIEKIELMQRLNEFVITKDAIINKVTQSKILFRGIKTSSGDQTANLKSIQGVSTWVLDEAEELTDEDKFDTINLSVREKSVQNRVILIMNPTTKEHWIYQKFFEQRGVKEGTNATIEDVNYIHTTYKDNINNLSDEFLNDIKRIKQNNPNKYKHKILGGWLDKAEGVVFTNWEFGKFNPDNLQTSFGMDFGYAVDPDTLVEVAIDKKKKIIYLKNHIYQNGLQLEALARLTKSKTGNKLVIADSAEPRLIADLKSRGINIKPVKKGTIESGITIMLDYKIIVDKESTSLAKELNNYVYLDKGSKLYIDDYNHCFIGSTKITTNKGYVNIVDISVGDKVLTSEGYKRVLKKFDNGIKKTYRYSMRFDTFVVSLICTPEHKIKTKQGWKQIKNITNKDTIYLSKHLTEKNTNCIKEKDTFLEVVKGCIQKFGNITKERYQKITTYIMLMVTLMTIELKTLILYIRNYISNTKEKNDLRTTQSLQKNFMLKALKPLRNGISQKKAESGIENIGKSQSVKSKQLKKTVKSVEKNTKLNSLNGQGFAITTAKLNRIDVIELQSQKVYDLMVEDCHEYLANDILVHNCIDASRYNITYQLDNPNKGTYYVY